MKPNWYVIIAQAVEDGVHAGLTLAVDHDERGDVMAQRIRDEIMVRLNEVIVWHDQRSTMPNSWEDVL